MFDCRNFIVVRNLSSEIDLHDTRDYFIFYYIIYNILLSFIFDDIYFYVKENGSELKSCCHVAFLFSVACPIARF